MDIISRLPGCAGQAADAVSAYTQLKSRMLPNYWKFQNRNVQTYGYVFQNINCRSHGNTLRILLFLLNESYTDTHSQDSVGKTVRQSIDGIWLGKSTKLGMLVCSQKNKHYSYRSMWHENDRKEAESSSYAEEIDERRWHRGVNIISWSRWVRMHSTGMRTKRENSWTIQQDVWIPYFCWSNREITRIGQTSRKNFSVVLRHGRTCWKMRGTVLRIGKQKDGATTQSFSSLFGRSPNQKGRIGKEWWIFRSLLPYCMKMFVLGTNWSTWHSISRFRLCRRSWRLKINIRRSFVHFWKSNICTDQLDVQEANVSHSSTESEIISLDPGLRMDGLLALDLWDLVIEVLGTTQRIPKKKTSTHTWNWC